MQFLSDLGEINQYYRYKIVTILTAPTIISPIPADAVPMFCTGYFLKANESGIWIIHTDKPTRDFFYHGQIVKIEEAALIDEKEVDPNTLQILNKEFKKHDEQQSIEEKELYEESGISVPDVQNPRNQEEVSSMLNKVQDMVEKKVADEHSDFLEKRVQPK